MLGIHSNTLLEMLPDAQCQVQILPASPSGSLGTSSLVKEQSHYALKFSRVDIGNFCMLDMHKRSVTLNKPV